MSAERTILAVAALFWFLSSPCWADSARIHTAFELTRSRCGYDLGSAQVEKVADASIQTSGSGNVKIIYSTDLGSENRHLKGTLTFNCFGGPLPASERESGGSTPSSPNTVPPTPKQIIEDEDSAGRYARVVAWQKKITAVNWVLNVAYVNSVMGDGQRSPSNYFLACNSVAAMPCIEIEMEKPKELSASESAKVLAFISGISVHR
jgi:hypothetical protein